MKRLNLNSILVLIFFGGVLFSPMIATGEETWYYCSVDFAGPVGSNTYIVLTDVTSESAFTKKWFVASDKKAKEILAVALAAMTKNLEVALRVDINNGEETPTIIALLLKK